MITLAGDEECGANIGDLHGHGAAVERKVAEFLIGVFAPGPNRAVCFKCGAKEEPRAH